MCTSSAFGVRLHLKWIVGHRVWPIFCNTYRADLRVSRKRALRISLSANYSGATYFNYFNNRSSYCDPDLASYFCSVLELLHQAWPGERPHCVYHRYMLPSRGSAMVSLSSLTFLFPFHILGSVGVLSGPLRRNKHTPTSCRRPIGLIHYLSSTKLKLMAVAFG